MTVISFNTTQVRQLRDVINQRMGDVNTARDRIRHVRNTLDVDTADPNVNGLHQRLDHLQRNLDTITNDLRHHHVTTNRFLTQAALIDRPLLFLPRPVPITGIVRPPIADRPRRPWRPELINDLFPPGGWYRPLPVWPPITFLPVPLPFRPFPGRLPPGWYAPLPVPVWPPFPPKIGRLLPFPPIMWFPVPRFPIKHLLPIRSSRPIRWEFHGPLGTRALDQLGRAGRTLFPGLSRLVQSPWRGVNLSDPALAQAWSRFVQISQGLRGIVMLRQRRDVRAAPRRRWTIPLPGAVLLPGGRLQGSSPDLRLPPPPTAAPPPQRPPEPPAPARPGDRQGVLPDRSGGGQEAYDQWKRPHGHLDQNDMWLNNCTSWVAFRRQMLGLSLRSGDGGTWAKDPNGVPTLGGIVSSKDDAAGHVMFIEEVFPDGSFRVSEMNYNGAGGWRDNVIWRRHGEQWISDPGGRVRTLYIDP